jgi:hypothetical protein
LSESAEYPFLISGTRQEATKRVYSGLVEYGQDYRSNEFGLVTQTSIGNIRIISAYYTETKPLYTPFTLVETSISDTTKTVQNASPTIITNQ